MANLANLVNFGSGGSLAVGDWTYSAYPLTAPAYLPLNDDTASYLTSSYPTLGAIYAPTTVAYSASSKNLPLYAPNTSYSAIFGNKTYFLCGTSGSVLASTDLTTWNTRSIPSRLMAAATSSPPAATTNYSFTSNQWNSFAYGNGRLVAIRSAPIAATGGTTFADGTSAVTSDGGQTWTFGAMPQSVSGAVLPVNWLSIAYGNGMFMAIGPSNGANTQVVASRSLDGLSWSSNITTIANTGFNAGQLAYGNGVWAFIYTDTGSWTVSYSTNQGNTWSNVTPFATTAKSIAYGNGVFVVVGADGTNAATTTCYTSPTGATWTARTLPSSQIWTSVTFANGYFVAVGTTGSASTAIATSTDGITWTAQVVPSSVTRYQVAGGNGKFFYQNDTGTTSTITQINLSVSSTSFTLPMAVGGPLGTIAYIKAT